MGRGAANVRRVDVAALVVSIASIVVSTLIAAASLRYARRADGRAKAAQAASERAEKREIASIRVMRLERMSEAVHEMSHAVAEAMNGEVSALGRVERNRARLWAGLNAWDGSLPNCLLVAKSPGASSSFPAALGELEEAIAREQAQADEP